MVNMQKVAVIGCCLLYTSGGNGGDSGSSSGNGYSYYEYHDYSNGSSSSHIDSIILVGVGGFLLFGGIMNAFNKNKQNVVKSHMWEKAQQVDAFWDEHILSDKISKSYFTIQQAWSCLLYTSESLLV